MWECLWLYLKAGDPRGQHQSHVVSVDHGEDTDGPGCDSPGVLVGILLLTRFLWILKDDLKHLGEVLTQMVGRSTLKKKRQR